MDITMVDAPQKDRDTLLCHGPSLSRRMAETQIRDMIRGTPPDMIEGYAAIIIRQSPVPAVSNVECLLEDLPPERALEALRIAELQLAKVHGLAGPVSPVLTPIQATKIRERAEHIVDMARASRIRGTGLGAALVGFDYAREAMVRIIMQELSFMTASTIGVERPLVAERRP